ncbi:MAG: hypothetical protein WKF43_13170 [Acidimicrobiales bacterium]
MTEPGPWTVRVLWAVLPFTAGPVLARALDPTVSSFRTVATVMLWVGWAVTVTVTLVPRTMSLTVLRIVAPAGVAATAWAAAVAGDDGAAWRTTLALASGLAAAAAAFSPFTGDAYVNGSSYGAERRMPLRVPGALLLLAPVAWMVTVVGTVGGPLLLATRQWGTGAVAVVAGGPAAAVAARALHGLARRWVVFVPAGLVLHDPFGLPDAVLVPRRMAHRLGPAPAHPVDEADVVDLTQRAPGLALLIELTEILPVSVAVGRREVGSVDARGLLFTPTRPGAVLEEAARRRLPVERPRPPLSARG